MLSPPNGMQSRNKRAGRGREALSEHANRFGSGKADDSYGDGRQALAGRAGRFVSRSQLHRRQHFRAFPAAPSRPMPPTARLCAALCKRLCLQFQNCQKSNRRKRTPCSSGGFCFGEKTLWATRIRNKRTLPLNFFRTFSAKNAHTASSFSASEKRDPPAFWQLLFSAPSAGEPSVFPYPFFQRAGKSGCFVSPFPFSLIRRKMLRFPPIPSPLHQRENVSLSVYSFPLPSEGKPSIPVFLYFLKVLGARGLTLTAPSGRKRKGEAHSPDFRSKIRDFNKVECHPAGDDLE